MSSNLCALINAFEDEDVEETEFSVDAEENTILSSLLDAQKKFTIESDIQPAAYSTNSNLCVLLSSFDNVVDEVEESPAPASACEKIIPAKSIPSLLAAHQHQENQLLFAASKSHSNGVAEKPLVSEYSIFDPAFGIRVRNPKVSLHTVNTYCNEMKKIRISALRKSGAPTDGEWATMAVIVSKTECRKSAADKKYVIWHVSDLTDIQDVPVKVLLFGECVEQHWKMQVGMTVLLVNAAVADVDATTKQMTLKVAKTAQIVDIGFCPDLGTCKAQRADGNSCTVHVNVTKTDYCVYHMHSAARKLSARRGIFGSSSNIPPKAWRQSTSAPAEPQPAGLQTASRGGAPKRFVKPVPRYMKLSKALPVAGPCDSASQPAAITPVQLLKNRSGVKRRDSFNSLQSAELPVKRVKSMKEFISSQENKPNLGSRARLGFIDLISPEKKSRAQTQEQMKIKRAAEILRKSVTKPAENLTRRHILKTDCTKESKSTGSLSDEQILLLMNRKSKFENEATEALQERQNRYFADREVEEKAETNATALMEIKNCKVVTCSACDYTSIHQSEYCRQLGHTVKRHTADKRFFRCRNCKTRISSFKLLPTKPCQTCLMIDYERVAMRDERKVHEEKLMIRGEERKYID